MLQKHSLRSLNDHGKTHTLVLIKALIIIHPPLTYQPGPSPLLRTSEFQSLLMTFVGTLRTQGCNKSSCNADIEMDQTKESGSVQRDRAVKEGVRDSSNKRPQDETGRSSSTPPGRASSARPRSSAPARGSARAPWLPRRTPGASPPGLTFPDPV